MKKLLFGLVLIGAMAGCKKSFLDVNDNPNTPTSTRADYAFTGAAITSAANMVGLMQLGGAWAGIYGFSTSFTGAGQQKTYVFSNADFDFWGPAYDNITDYNYVVNNGVKDGYAHLVGPAIIMRAYLFQRLVDTYNNIPYFEAFQITKDVTPAYTAGQVVYEDLIKKLDSAITLMKATTFPSSAPEDVIFKGNKTNWIKFANTLKLRILNRQSLIAGRSSYITTEVNKIIAEGSGFLTTNVTIQPGYSKATNKLNPLYGNLGFNENDVEQQNHRFYKMNSYIINYLKATSDTFRLQLKADIRANSPSPYDVTNFGNYVGVALGQGSGASETTVSSIGYSLISRPPFPLTGAPIIASTAEPARPVVMFTLAESWFLQAEIAQRFGLLGSAETNYNTGVIEAFKLDAGNGTSGAPKFSAAVATARANQYLASGQNNVTFAVSTNKIQAIIEQKWLALANHNNFEAWTEWRRTGYPAVPVSLLASPGTTQPRRLYYPLSEQNTNEANYNAQGVINPYTGRIFWDVR